MVLQNRQHEGLDLPMVALPSIPHGARYWMLKLSCSALASDLLAYIRPLRKKAWSVCHSLIPDITG